MTKNLIITALLTYIFYTDFCVVKQPLYMVFVGGLFLFIICSVEDYMRDYIKSVRRGERLTKGVRRLKR